MSRSRVSASAWRATIESAVGRTVGENSWGLRWAMSNRRRASAITDRSSNRLSAARTVSRSVAAFGSSFTWASHPRRTAKGRSMSRAKALNAVWLVLPS